MSAGSRAEPSLPGNRSPASLLDRLLELRHRFIANPNFQRWSSRFPLTRGIAQRKANQLFNIATGFVNYQVFAACVSLDLFERLREGPRDCVELARECGLPTEGMLRLLLAASALELLTDRGDQRFGLGDLGAAVLGNPGAAAMALHHRHLYRDLADPLALLRRESSTELAKFWPYATGTEGGAAEYSELMATSQSLVAVDILDAYPMQGHRQLRDIAGGSGSFACSALARWPELKASVLDLPEVAELAQQRFAEQGIGERASATSGDMFTDPLAGARDADLISLVRVVHDHDDEDVMRLFRSLRESMAPGASLLIAEPMAETPGAESMGHAYFGFYLLAMGSGRPRTAGELTRMLKDAGFSRCRELKTARPLMVRVLVAEP